MLVLMLSSFVKVSIDSSENMNPSAFTEPNNNKEEKQTYSSHLEVTIAEHFPSFTFDIEKVGEEDAKWNVYQISIACPEEPDLISQTFELSSPFESGLSGVLSFVDIDCDGYLDIELVNYRGAANIGREYYRWDSHSNEYEEAPFFEMGGVDYEIFSDTRQIIVTTHSSASTYSRVLYQLIDGEYLELRTEYAQVIADDDQYKFEVHILSEQGELYSETLSQEEYFGTRNNDESGLVREHFLRFGSAEPNERFDVTIETYVCDNANPDANISIEYLQIDGLLDTEKQQRINQILYERVLDFQGAYECNPDDLYDLSGLMEYDVDAEYTAYGSILSVRYSLSFWHTIAAHPSTYLYTMVIDVRTGEALILSDLLILNDAFEEMFNEDKIALTRVVEVPTEIYENFYAELHDSIIAGYSSKSGFYLTTNTIGFVFDVPHAVGDYWTFEIAYDDISDFLNPDVQGLIVHKSSVDIGNC